MADVARAANRYPNIEVNYDMENKEEISSGSQVTVNVKLEREIDEDDEVILHVFHYSLVIRLDTFMHPFSPSLKQKAGGL